MSMAARIGWIVLICVTLYVCYFSHLGAIGFVGPDEPRYAWVAREMVETGDWITPRLYGRPWFEKPPLYYWGAAIFFKVFGVSEAAARLPSAISALLATLAMAWLAWRVYGAETARWLLLLLPTTVGMIGFSHAAATDMPFSAMLTVTMVCAAVIVGVAGAEDQDGRADAGKRNHEGLEPEGSCQGGAQLAASLRRNGVGRYRLLAIILFGFFLGLAVLAKGPAGVILCGGAVSFWALFTKRWRDALRLLHPAGIAAFCATALPWYILCARRNPDFFRIFIIEHNFKRYLTPEFQHIQPFWFYIPIVVVAIVPWTPLLIQVFIEDRRVPHGSVEASFILFIALWGGFPIGFFSASGSKLPGYILPAVPALMFLCAASIGTFPGRSVVRGSILAAALLAGLMFLGASKYAHHVRAMFPPMMSLDEPLLYPTIRLSSYIFVTVAIIWAVRAHMKTGVVWVAVAVVATLMASPFSTLDLALSSRPAATAFPEMRQPGSEVRTCGIPRSYTFGLEFYLHHELQELDSRDENLRTPLIVVSGAERCAAKVQQLQYRAVWELRLPKVSVFSLKEPLAGAAGGKTQ